MAPQLAVTRLRKELLKLKQDPPPGVIAEPNESDILVWHYAVRGPVDTPYQGGIYIGKIKFHPDYPLKAPSIYMLTPSGRFECNKKICMSMSDFHPESWNPLWSVATIIQGIQSFMASDELTTGGMKASDMDRKKFAAVSMVYNQKAFPRLFDGNIEEAFALADQAREEAEKNKVVDAGSTSRRRRSRRKPIEVDGDTQQSETIVSDEGGDGNELEAAEQLSAEEIEKRRKRNAKKRARQKAKKAAIKTGTDDNVVGTSNEKSGVIVEEDTREANDKTALDAVEGLNIN